MIQGLQHDLDLASLAKALARHFSGPKAEELQRLVEQSSLSESKDQIFKALKTVPDEWNVEIRYETIPRGSGGHYPARGYDFVSVYVLTDDGGRILIGSF